MSIQTVTTILSEAEDVLSGLIPAVGFARAIDAHLHVLVLATGMEQAAAMPSALEALPAGVGLDISEARAEEISTVVADRLAREDVRWHVDVLASPASGASAEIVRQTRFSDLVVLTRAEDAQAPETARFLAETILFDADTPLLLLPAQGGITAPLRKIMVSWDESTTALRAARQALPLLAKGAYVHIVLVDPPRNSPERSDPGGAFAQFLSRHGIRCEVSVCNRTDDSVSATLERRAKELGCDMIVMGAYGHSRLRQAIFGGTTRDILTKAEVPVFMAH